MLGLVQQVLDEDRRSGVGEPAAHGAPSLLISLALHTVSGAQGSPAADEPVPRSGGRTYPDASRPSTWSTHAAPPPRPRRRRDPRRARRLRPRGRVRRARDVPRLLRGRFVVGVLLPRDDEDP